jgi:hypothetical protein
MKVLNQASKNPIQDRIGSFTGLPVRQNFSSKIIGLEASADISPKPQKLAPRQIAAEAFRLRVVTLTGIGARAGFFRQIATTRHPAMPAPRPKRSRR